MAPVAACRGLNGSNGNKCINYKEPHAIVNDLSESGCWQGVPCVRGGCAGALVWRSPGVELRALLADQRAAPVALLTQ